MKYKSNQQVVELVAYHLGYQFKRSTKKNSDTCAYRGKNNLKCAIGCLIPNHLYYPKLENKIFLDLVNNYSYNYNKKIANIFKNIDHDIIRSLQIIHDSYHPNQWKNEIKDLSIHYRLDSEKILEKFDQGYKNRKTKNENTINLQSN